jgi:serine/threonine protein phosphatase 1
MATYISADIHGSFSRLWRRLQALNFDPSKDVVYSLGDLVNRGEESCYVAEWLQKPWFKPVRGNHEHIVLQAHANPSDEKNTALLRSLNGDWWFRLSAQQQTQVANGLDSLPYARTFTCQGQRIGIVHADIYEGLSWDDYCAQLQAGDADAREMALWSRWRWKAVIGSGLSASQVQPVAGVDWVFVGHSPVDRPTVVGNVVYTDCGLWRGNDAGVFCLDDWLAEQAQ